jgi:hypothetical protein
MTLKDKSIIFCLPGNTYSGTFMMSFIELLGFISSQGANFKVSQHPHKPLLVVGLDSAPSVTPRNPLTATTTKW